MEETNKEKNLKEIIRSYILNVGILLLVFIIMDILVTTIFQIINIPMSIANIIVATLITILIFLVINKRKINKSNIAIYLISIIVTILIFILATYCIGKTFDTSCDGNFYHKTAIGLIKEGWNPLYEGSEEFCEKLDTEIENEGQFLWIDHYPKVTWNFAASIYAVTNNIESGKVITILLAISLACLTYYYLSDRLLKKWQAGLIAIAIPINPIVLSQLFTFYVDGIMGLLIYGIILFLVMIADTKFDAISSRVKWFGLAAEITLCMNIKFTGIYFAAIFSIVFYIFWLVQSIKDNRFKEVFFKTTINFIIIVIVGIGIVGASTYIKNTIEHKNPLYPIIGKDKVDIITTMQPESFGEKNRFVKLFESIFAVSENITYTSGNSPDLKIPFSIKDEEINNLAIPDTRIGGYGIFFSGILLISIITFIYSIIKIFKNNKNVFKYIIAILLGTFVTTLCMAEAWWARYSPQLYLIPILAMFGLFYIANVNKSKAKAILENVISSIVFIIMMINVCVFVYWRIEDIEVARNVKYSMYNLKEMAESRDEIEISFNNNNYYGIIFNLRDYNVKYKLTDNKESKENYAYNYQLLY